MISLSECSKAFHRGGANEVQALEGITIELDEGDFATVIGSNGAGKSTLLNAVAGVFFLDQGTISVAGRDVTRWPEYKRATLIARVFQNPLLGTCPSATIEQNLALARRRGKRRGLAPGVRQRERAQFINALGTIGLGLEHRLRDRVGLLSGGQRQALTMLMATLVRPEVLLLDEHTAALDPKTARQILALTRNIIAEHKLTALMVTHNMKDAIALGNRLIMLHQGRVIVDVAGADKQQLTVDDLLQKFYQVQGEALANDSMLLI
jgi:putative ABC transport system ATP-binding protein